MPWQEALLYAIAAAGLAWAFRALLEAGGAVRIPALGIIFGILAALFIGNVKAHDHAHPDLNGWLKSLHAKNSTWCCDGNDTDAIEDWQTSGSKYRVKFGGQWFDVPDDAVVDGPNKAADALLWMNKGYGGPSVRCFMPGMMG